MTSRPFRITMTVAAALILTAPALAAEGRHQLIEPIHPDHRLQERAAGRTPKDKLCYCRTLHERNAAGRLMWKVVCSDKGPTHGARKIRAEDCRSLRNLPPT